MKKEIYREISKRLVEHGQGQLSLDPAVMIWHQVIGETLEEYRRDGWDNKARLLELRYFEGMTEEQVEEELHISHGAYWKWKRDTFATLAAKAAWHRLVKP